MKNVITSTYCVILITLLISGESLLGIAQDEHTVLLSTFETGEGIEGVLAVKPQDKLIITWGKLKSDFAR